MVENHRSHAVHHELTINDVEHIAERVLLRHEFIKQLKDSIVALQTRQPASVSKEAMRDVATQEWHRWSETILPGRVLHLVSDGLRDQSALRGILDIHISEIKTMLSNQQATFERVRHDEQQRFQRSVEEISKQHLQQLQRSDEASLFFRSIEEKTHSRQNGMLFMACLGSLAFGVAGGMIANRWNLGTPR